MKRILIMVPSYKRPSVLDFTLKNLCLSIDRGRYDIEIVVGLNKATRIERNIVLDRRKLSEGSDLAINYIYFENNVGKAECLNIIVDRYFRNQDYVINLDNDMWIKKPWLDMLCVLDGVDYDMVGFGGTCFWSHTPKINDVYEARGKYRLYSRPHIAGGLSLYSPSFIRDFKFFGHGGVYGGVDGHSCTQAKNKYVIYWDCDWLEHDPLINSTQTLKNYQDKKSLLLSKNVLFFPEGWDD